MAVSRMTFHRAKHPGIDVVVQEGTCAAEALRKTMEHIPLCKDRKLLKLEIKHVPQNGWFPWWESIDIEQFAKLCG